MREILKSSLWKKITAVICMVTLLITSFYFVPNEKVKAQGKDVTSIRLKGANNIDWCDDEEEPFEIYYEELDGEHSVSGSETYEFIMDGDDIIVYPREGAEFGRKEIFYVKTDGKLNVTSNNGAKLTVSEGLGSYKVSVSLVQATGEVTLTPIPQYNVTFPNDSDEYTITEYNSDTSYAGKTVQVTANGSLKFSIKLNDPLSKSVKVTANGKTLSADEDSTAECYNYTLNQVSQNTTISVASVDKTFEVLLPTVEGYTVRSAGGGNVIEVGGVYNFYVTPEDGYVSPQSVKANCGEVVSLGNNLYQLSLDKEALETFDEDTITITLEGTGKEKLNVIYRADTGYTIQDEVGELLTTELVTYGDQLRFKVVAEEGYKVTGVYVNNLPVEEEDGIYVTPPITTTATVTATATPKTYHIATPAGGDGYTFLGNGSTTVSYGGSYSFIVAAAPGYEEPTVYAYPGSEENEEFRSEEYKLTGANGTYVVGNVASDMYIDVQAGSRIQYRVDFSSETGYAFRDVSIDGSTAEYGVVVSFGVEPSEGYSITSVRANSTILSENEKGLYTFTVREDTAIRVTVEKKTYSVTVPEVSDAYTFTPVGSSPVEYGGSYSFYVTANEKYNQPTVSYTMGDTSHPITPVSDNLYVISPISGDVTIEVTPGSLKTQTVYLNQKEGVTFRNAVTNEIDSSNVSVNYGDSYSFKLELSSDYNESTPYVTVNDRHIEPNGEGVYTISDIKADQVVSVANVVKNIYAVTLKQGVGYTLTTTENTKVEAGNSFTFSVSAETGYDLSNAAVYYKTADGQSTLVESSDNGYYTISEVHSNIEVYVEGVSQIAFRANVESAHASVTATEGSNLENIAYNGSISFTVTPDDYYDLSQVAVDGVVREAVNGVYTINNITSNINIQVITTPKTLITVEYQDSKFENSGTDTFTIEDIESEKAVIKDPVYSSTSYTFAGWFDEEGVQWERDAILTEDDINSHIVLTARWALTEKVLEGLVTNGSITNSSESQYVVTISTLLNFAQDLEESDKANITIVGYGTLYAPEKFTISEEVKREVEKLEGESGKLLTKKINDRLMNYCYNCSTPANEFNSEGFALAATSAKEPSQRWGAGWIAIRVPGIENTIFVYADPVQATKTVDVAQALAAVINATPNDQATPETSDVSAQNDMDLMEQREDRDLEEALPVKEIQTEQSTEETQTEPVVNESQDEEATEEAQTESLAEEMEAESVMEEEEAETSVEEIQTDSTETEASADSNANEQMPEVTVE